MLTEKPGNMLASFCRLALFTSYVIPDAASAGIWSVTFYSEPASLANQVIGLFGIGWLSWLGDKNLALPTIILYSIWKNVGFGTLIYAAGLKSIPKTYYEVAEVDGASKSTVLRRITLPLLKPIILFITVTSFISGWQAFTEVYILTQGGPGTATLTLPLYIYNTAFSMGNGGYASVAVIFLFLIILSLTIINFKYIRGE